MANMFGNTQRPIWHVYYGTRGAAGAYIDALQGCLEHSGIPSVAFVSSGYRYPTHGVHKIFFPFTERWEHRNKFLLGLRAIELIAGYMSVLLMAAFVRPAINLHLADNYLATLIFGRLCIALRLNTIVTCHDVLPHDDESSSARIELLRAADRLIVHSDDAALQLTDLLGDSSAKRIRKCSFPFSSYDRLSSNAQPADAGLLPDILPSDYVLFVGVVRLSKGIDTLIQAWEELGTEAPGHLVIAGKWPKTLRELKVRAHTISRCVVLDRYLSDQEFSHVISRASWVILPYKRYTHSSILFSCLNAGVPMIVSDCGLFREMLPGYKPVFGMQSSVQLAAMLRQTRRDDYRSESTARLREIYSRYEQNLISSVSDAYQL